VLFSPQWYLIFLALLVGRRPSLRNEYKGGFVTFADGGRVPTGPYYGILAAEGMPQVPTVPSL
jgi:hypothetical protein